MFKSLTLISILSCKNRESFRRSASKPKWQMMKKKPQNQYFPKYKHGIFRHRDGSFLFTIRGTRAPIFVRSYMVQFSIYRISRFSSSFRHFGAERRKLSLFLHDKMEISVKLLNKVVLCRTLGSFYPKQTPFFCSCAYKFHSSTKGLSWSQLFTRLFRNRKPRLKQG